MSGKELLEAMGNIRSDYVQEAAEESSGGRSSRRRILLMAAAAALAALLVGCAVVYVLNMRNMQVGQQKDRQAVYSEDGDGLLGYEEVPQQVLTFSGIKGSRNYQAAREWFDFCQSYDPDGTLLASLEGELSQYPDLYTAYQPYSDEMVQKLDEIAEKYGLKLLGRPQDFRTAKTALRALNLESLLCTDSGATLDMMDLTCYEGGNFSMTGDIRMAEGEDAWNYSILTVLSYHNKDYLKTDLLALDVKDSWREWNYTTASGAEVLILRSDSDWRGFIFHDREDATITARVEAIRYTSSNGETNAHVMTDRQLELLADVIDFDIHPDTIPPDADFSGTEAVGPVTQNGYTLEIKSAVSDGHTATIILGITGPEDVDLEQDNYRIRPGNWDDGLLQADGENVIISLGVGTQKNLDGLDHTTQLEFSLISELPIREGQRWDLYVEDLILEWWDTKTGHHTDTLTEGVWSLEIPFDFSHVGERELAEESFPVSVIVGMNEEGAVYEDVTVTSFVLRPMSATITCDTREFAPDFSSVTVHMKNGPRVYLHSRSAYIGVQELTASRTIDLSQVDYIRFADDTILEVPDGD